MAEISVMAMAMISVSCRGCKKSICLIAAIVFSLSLAMLSGCSGKRTIKNTSSAEITGSEVTSSPVTASTAEETEAESQNPSGSAAAEKKADSSSKVLSSAVRSNGTAGVNASSAYGSGSKTQTPVSAALQTAASKVDDENFGALVPLE